MRKSESERQQRFDALFASYSSDIVAYCGWRAGSASDAQDAAAEVYLTAWRRLDRVPAGEAARLWLYATARRVIAKQRRSGRRRVALQERLALEAAAAPPESPAFDEEETLVHEALGRLGGARSGGPAARGVGGAVRRADRSRPRLPDGDRARTAPPRAAAIPRRV